MDGGPLVLQPCPLLYISLDRLDVVGNVLKVSLQPAEFEFELVGLFMEVKELTLVVGLQRFELADLGFELFPRQSLDGGFAGIEFAVDIIAVELELLTAVPFSLNVISL